MPSMAGSKGGVEKSPPKKNKSETVKAGSAAGSKGNIKESPLKK